MQAPSDTNRVNITQLQTMSNTFLSCGLGLTQTQGAPLPQWQFRDRLCLHSDLPSSPSPPSLTQVCQREHLADVGQTWQEALIYSHFEIKEGEALTLNMTNEGHIDFLSLLETGPGCVCRSEGLLQGKQIGTTSDRENPAELSFCASIHQCKNSFFFGKLYFENVICYTSWSNTTK